MATIETICGAGHVEFVVPGPYSNPWVGRSCCRRLTDGRSCHAPIISAFFLEPEPAAPDCGIVGPHAPGAHPPAIDPGWGLGEDEDPAALELDEDEDDKLGRRPATG